MTGGSRRILVTGLSTYWGGRLAQALEAFDSVEAVIGVDNEEPHVELERTEYVKVGAQHALLRRVVEAAEIDTVVDTRLVVDSPTTTTARAHENNVIGTMNILAACSGSGSPVRKVVFKSSTHFYGCEQDDPAFFDESMGRSRRPRTGIERDVVEAEASVGDFADKNPDVDVTILRFANVLGPDVKTSHIDLFSLPAMPMILGFDPRYQFVHEDDVVHALEHAVTKRHPRRVQRRGRRRAGAERGGGPPGQALRARDPALGHRPGRVGAAARGHQDPARDRGPAALRPRRGQPPLQGHRLPLPAHQPGVGDEAGEHLRLQPVVRGVHEPYRYEREVEEFLRWSPHVKNARGTAGRPHLDREQMAELRRLVDGLEGDAPEAEPRLEEERLAEEQRWAHVEAGDRAAEPPAAPAPPAAPPVEHYDDLAAEEVIALLGSLEADDLASAARSRAPATPAGSASWPRSTRSWPAPDSAGGASLPAPVGAQNPRKGRCTRFGPPGLCLHSHPRRRRYCA